MAPLGLVTFLTDYGLDDPFVGQCHAVMAHLATAVRVVDLTHAIAPGDIAHGALLLADAVGRLPPAVHLAVIDPGVGTGRRAIVVAAGDRFLVGPDNGLLAPAVAALGGGVAAWVISDPPALPWPAARTFDGRDVFAPVAARLAAGDDPQRFGPAVDLVALQPHALPAPVPCHGGLDAAVVHVDRFGNLALAARPSDWPGGWPPAAVAITTPDGTRWSATAGLTFGDVPTGGLVCHPDAAGRLALAVNAGNAAEVLGLDRGDVVELRAVGTH
jgi:S-adenosyl-L-methionine hydrolase (adenosine-forming)